MMKKIKVAVLYGGRSPEHDVSIKSALSIINYINSDKFDVIPIYVDISGQWYYNFEPANITSDKGIFSQGSDINTTTESIKKMKNSIDVVFPAMHGIYGEDGLIQGTLEALSIPYVGCDVLSSSITMDKAMTKTIALANNINIGKFLNFSETKWMTSKKELLDKIASNISFPIFVKPCNSGSSIAINKAKNFKELEKYIENALLFDENILVEEAIVGKELEIAVLENISDKNIPFVSKPAELVPKDEFYTFKAKYVLEHGADFHIPSRLDDSQIEKARKIAANIFKIFRCKSLARIDMFFNERDQKFYLNEINTIPGFTNISLYPKLIGHLGIEYPDLIEKLILLAIDYHSKKQVKILNFIDFKQKQKLF